jgi:hypothetical protein
MLRPETRLFIDRTAEIMRQFADTVTGDDLLLVTEVEVAMGECGIEPGKIILGLFLAIMAERRQADTARSELMKIGKKAFWATKQTGAEPAR